MALITCSDCGTNVSDRATACPKCACPLTSTSKPEQTTVLIEQTAKKLKVIRLMGMALIVVAIIVAALLSDQHGPTGKGYALGAIVGFAGIACWVYGMGLTWWHHG